MTYADALTVDFMYRYRFWLAADPHGARWRVNDGNGRAVADLPAGLGGEATRAGRRSLVTPA